MQGREEIERLILIYAERIDAGDFKGVAELFDRGTIYGPGRVEGARGSDAVQRLYESTTRRYEDGTPKTKHVTSNLIFEIEENAAEVRSYFTVFQSLPDFPLQPIISGRYRDRFKRLHGTWCFVERHMIPELYGDLSRHLLIQIPKT